VLDDARERLEPIVVQPARAEAKEQALACNPKEVALLRAQWRHEDAYVRASQALLKVRAALVATGLRPGGPVVWEAKLIAGPAPNEPLSPWQRFFGHG
jgi:hypothetical protein